MLPLRRVLLQVFGLGFVLFSFGGASLPFSEESCLNATSAAPGLSAFNCYPLALAESCRVGLLSCWAIAFVQLTASLLVQVGNIYSGCSTTRTVRSRQRQKRRTFPS